MAGLSIMRTLPTKEKHRICEPATFLSSPKRIVSIIAESFTVYPLPDQFAIGEQSGEIDLPAALDTLDKM